MIIYNVRNMGGYLSDVLRLNIYQLYNKVREGKRSYEESAIHSQLKLLNDKVKELTLCDENCTQMEKLLLFRKAKDNK